ncbi:MAG: hypothetical protein PVJ06_14790, partial [Desulfobacterales bacterium]
NITGSPTGILKYVKDLKRGPNTEIGGKDFFEIASSMHATHRQARPSNFSWPFEKNIFSLTLIKIFIYLILDESEADSKLSLGG